MARSPQSPSPARKAPARKAVRPGIGCGGWIARLLGDLAGQGIGVRDISTTQSSLEEIFMNLVSETPRVQA